MGVFEDPNNRLSSRQAFKLPDQRLQRPLLFPWRTEVRQRMALRGRQCEQVGEKCHIPVGRRGASEQCLEFFQLDRRRIVACEPGRSSKLLYERKKCTVLVIRRAKIVEAKMRLKLQALFELRRDARLADSGFAGDKRDLAVARLGARPRAR